MDEATKSSRSPLVIVVVGLALVALLPLLGVVGLVGFVLPGDQACAAEAGVAGDGAQDLSEGKIPAEYVKDIQDAAKVSGVPASVLAAQIQQESGFNPKACSSAGACGIAQFIDATWAKYSHGAPRTDPHAGIRAQGEYMRDLMGIVSGLSGSGKASQVELALAAYNAGEGAVLSHHGIPPFAETQNYVKIITANAAKYSVEEKKDAKKDSAAAGSGVAPVAGTSQVQITTVAKKTSTGVSAMGSCPDTQANAAGGYSGGSVSGNDDFPWKNADGSGVNTVSLFYYRQCVDFAMWRVNQQVGATDPNKPKYTNNKGPWGHLGNGGEWANAWRAGGWPVDKKPEVGAVAHFDPGVSGAGSVGHVGVVKEIKGDQVVIEEYNAITPLGYGTRTMPASGVSNYLHIPDSEKAKK